MLRQKRQICDRPILNKAGFSTDHCAYFSVLGYKRLQAVVTVLDTEGSIDRQLYCVNYAICMIYSLLPN